MEHLNLIVLVISTICFIYGIYNVLRDEKPLSRGYLPIILSIILIIIHNIFVLYNPQPNTPVYEKVSLNEIKEIANA